MIQLVFKYYLLYYYLNSKIFNENHCKFWKKSVLFFLVFVFYAYIYVALICFFQF